MISNIFKLICIFSVTNIAKYITDDVIYMHLLINYLFIKNNYSVILHILTIWLYMGFYVLNFQFIWISSIIFCLIFLIYSQLFAKKSNEINNQAFLLPSIMKYLLLCFFIFLLFLIGNYSNLDINYIYPIIMKNFIVNYLIYRQFFTN